MNKPTQPDKKRKEILKLNELFDLRVSQIDEINKGSDGFNPLYYHKDQTMQYLNRLLINIKYNL